MQVDDVATRDLGDFHRAKFGADMVADQPGIAAPCRGFAMFLGILFHEAVAERGHRRGVKAGLFLGGWVKPARYVTQKLLGACAGFLGGQRAVLTDGDAS